MSTRDRLAGTVGAAIETVRSVGAGRGLTGRGLSAKRLVLGVVVVAIVVLTVIPLLFLLWTSVWSGFPGELAASFTTENFATVYTEGFFDVWELFANSLVIAVGMTATGMALGLTFAWLFVRTNLPSKGAMELVLLSGQAIPGYVYAIMYITAYGPDNGLVDGALREAVGVGFPLDIFNPWGIAFVVGVNVVPTFYLLTVPALQDMDPALEEASRIHGAGAVETIRSVTLPLIKPALLSGALVTFLYGLGEFAIVAILGARNGYDVYSTAIWRSITGGFPPAYGEAAALSCSLLLLTLVLVWYYRTVTRRKEQFMTLSSGGTHAGTWDLGRWRLPLAGALWGVLLFVWLLPTVVMVVASLHGSWVGEVHVGALSLDNYRLALTDPGLRDAFANSLVVALGGATLGTVLVVGMAYYTERTDGRLGGLVDFLSLTPLAVPGIIMGSSLLFTFLWVGQLLPFLNLYGTVTIIAVGCVVVFLPVASRIAIGNIVQVHAELEEAGRIAGASWLGQMRAIFLPLFRNSAAVIWFFLAIHVFQLLSIPLMTYTTDTVVIPVKLFELYMYRPNIELVSAISTIFIGLTVALVVALRYLGIRFYELGTR
ncbi:ABC transporter permease [Haloarcula onubensis]|uniref:Iron ABC transporter permease n=1 Tax=Haloarcula onubensis TaxID=2950539 RepID=A0ABU2FLK4_9EURY|nr:iron ABC transporter permease [Halomicroarcula sp. S3CR25-11]MDS0281649.1 iron ABC transporter permease [Halomicroarcula sp. S3CR25-11]